MLSPSVSIDLELSVGEERDESFHANSHAMEPQHTNQIIYDSYVQSTLSYEKN